MTYENEQSIKEEPIFALPKLIGKWWNIFSPLRQDGVFVYRDRVIQDSTTRGAPMVFATDDIVKIWVTKRTGRYDVHMSVQAPATQIYGTTVPAGMAMKRYVMRGMVEEDAKALVTVIGQVSRNLVQAE